MEEIRADDLRLTSTESALFLNRVMDLPHAKFDELKAGARPQEIAAAQAALAGAQAALQKLQQGPDENQLIASGAEVANAEAVLKQAYAAYDRAGGAGNPYASILPTSLALEQVVNSANAARARHAALQIGPRAAELAAARAEIQRAQAQLDLIKAGTRPETLAAAESEVASARAALDQARIALANTELRAPFAGLIASLDARVGENKQGDIVYTVVVSPSQNELALRWNMTAKVSVPPRY
jgi:HlyD family secretion protein